MIESQELKAIHFRLDKKEWMFLKHETVRLEVSMADVLRACIDSYKKEIKEKS